MGEAVVIGAGCIGRGFVGPLFSAAGWHVTFLDIDAPLVAALARDRSYVQVQYETCGAVRADVGPVSAIDNGVNPDAAVTALVAADVAATAVGGSQLPEIAPLLAEAARQRVRLGRPVLNVLLCENVHGAATVMRSLLGDDDLGLIETSIDRAIPLMDPAVRAVDPTLIHADPYRPLLYDVAAVRGDGFDVPGIVGDPSVPFAFFGERKLYVHNLGHAMTAYLGELVGVGLVSDAIAIPAVRRVVRGAMVESATALSRRYGQPLEPILDLVDDLLGRFADATIPDTVERVGRDPIRKTAPGDRLVGAYELALAEHVPSPHLSLAVALGADALRRHEGWSPERVARHLGLAGLTPDQADLLASQIALLAGGVDARDLEKGMS